MLPDFLYIGTYRTGSTWLYKVLSRHPDIFLPNEKETMFFNIYYDRGIAWYEKFFKSAENEQMRGEICPSYLTSPNAAKRIYDCTPNVKLIAVLRNPIEQVKSMYKLWIMRGKVNLPLEEVLSKKEILLDNVMYFKNLSRYLEYFDKEKLLILLYDYLQNDSREFLSHIYKFLGVRYSYPYYAGDRENISRKPRFSFIDKLIASGGKLFRDHNLYGVKGIFKRMRIIDTIKAANSYKYAKIKIKREVEDYIKDKTFDDTEKLSEFLGKDLSIWK